MAQEHQGDYSHPVYTPPEPREKPVNANSTPAYVNVTLKQICSCESDGKKYGEPTQFKIDGTVLRGKVNPQDVGACQINEKYHLASSIALGYDIYTLEGNWGYAEYLFKTQGTKPWNWSRKCWGT